ncbi:MAG: glucose-6-phosphate isomerase, partial [Bdellovibrio sp.]
KGHHFGEILKAQARGTAQSLREQQVPVIELLMEDLSDYSMGWNLMFWELLVATLGSVLRIDTFNQPGVEIGKRISKSFLVGSKDP